MNPHCALCGRPITNPDARFGPDCQVRYDRALIMNGTTPAEIAELLIAGDATTHRWLTRATSALLIGLKTSGAARWRAWRDAKFFFAGRTEGARHTGRARRPGGRGLTGLSFAEGVNPKPFFVM